MFKRDKFGHHFILITGSWKSHKFIIDIFDQNFSFDEFWLF